MAKGLRSTMKAESDPRPYESAKSEIFWALWLVVGVLSFVPMLAFELVRVAIAFASGTVRPRRQSKTPRGPQRAAVAAGPAVDERAEFANSCNLSFVWRWLLLLFVLALVWQDVVIQELQRVLTSVNYELASETIAIAHEVSRPGGCDPYPLLGTLYGLCEQLSGA